MKEKTKKILLLLTGGTIGSTVRDQCIDVDEQSINDLLMQYKIDGNPHVEFETRRLFHILSENMEPKHWLQIITALRSHPFDQYDGIIITHGTDTLPYTGAALCFGIETPSIPIVLVAANRPLTHPESRALANFSASVAFILKLKLPGFYVIYENSDHLVHVHLASRLQEADSLGDFTSAGPAFGFYDQRGLCCTPSPQNPSFVNLFNPVPTEIAHVPAFRHEILSLKVYPGFNYALIDLRKRPVRAVLHALYHSGSGNVMSDDGTSLLKFIKDNQNVDHYLLPSKNMQDDCYASSQVLIEAGAIPLPGISFEAALTKLHFAYNQNEYAPLYYMKREFFHEFH